MQRHNFTFENLAQENSPKISKHAHKVGKNGQKVKKMNKIMNFPVCTYKFQNLAQSKQNLAPVHDGETVIYRNSAKNLDKNQILKQQQTKKEKKKK